MKVVIAAPSFPPAVGGVETITRDLVKGLVGQGHEVTVITRKVNNAPSSEYRYGARIIRGWWLYPQRGYFKKGRMALFTASVLLFVVYLLKAAVLLLSIRPDIVHVQYPDRYAVYLYLLKPFFRYRILTSFHGHDVLRIMDRTVILGAIPKSSMDNPVYDKRFLRWIIRKSDHVTACSAWLLQQVNNICSKWEIETSVLHNGIGIKAVKHDSPLDGYVFAYGRLVATKGFDVLLRAYVLARTRNYAGKILIAGAGEHFSSLQRLAVELDLDPGEIFLGVLDQVSVVKFLRGASTVVIPSREEPFGIVALEAQLHYCPVIASKVGGLTEIIAHGHNGILVEPGDVNALADALIYMADNREAAVRMAIHGRETVEKMFSMERYVTSTVKLYRSLLSKKESHRQVVLP